MPSPKRKTTHLRWGRISLPGARYFLTLCTHQRVPVLTTPATPTRIRDTLHSLQASGDLDLLAATIMPDHVHLLFGLGSTLTLGQTMAKFKSLSRDLGRAPWHWLDNGFDHRLRPDELSEDYAFYIFMNAYRARLIPITETWPWWFCPDSNRFLFPMHLTPTGIPPPEWLEIPDKPLDTGDM